MIQQNTGTFLFKFVFFLSCSVSLSISLSLFLYMSFESRIRMHKMNFHNSQYIEHETWIAGGIGEGSDFVWIMFNMFIFIIIFRFSSFYLFLLCKLLLYFSYHKRQSNKILTPCALRTQHKHNIALNI